jgi:signal transduction histidine kinase
MTTSDTLRWGAILSVAFLVLMSGLTLYAAYSINTAVERGRSAEAIVRSTFDMSALTEEYLVRPNERVLDQWKATHDEIDALLAEQTTDSSDAADLLASLHEKNDATAITFTDSMEHTDGALPMLTERQAAQFRSNTEGMVTDATNLAELYFTKQEAARRAIVSMIVLLTTAFSGFTIWAAFRLRSAHLEHEQMIAELREQDEKKNTFIAMLSHELRNPLSPIVSSVEYAQMLPIEDPEVRRSLDVISRQALNMKILLEDLLDVSRMIRGKIELQMAKVDLRQVVNHTLETATPMLQKKGQSIELYIPERPVMVEADSLRIEQVLINILTNASKFSPEGSSVALTLDVEGPNAVIVVRDRGIGIERSFQQKIFDIFSQERRQSTGAHTEGLGIGLSLARALAQMHGGDVTVFSEGEGRGSEFTITLPLNTS